jgi:hypothetical protein
MEQDEGTQDHIVITRDMTDAEVAERVIKVIGHARAGQIAMKYDFGLKVSPEPKPVQPMPPSQAWPNFYLTTDLAARLALGNGLSRSDVAMSLESLAAAIRDPSSVAESTEPIDVSNSSPGEVCL